MSSSAGQILTGESMPQLQDCRRTDTGYIQVGKCTPEQNATVQRIASSSSGTPDTGDGGPDGHVPKLSRGGGHAPPVVERLPRQCRQQDKVIHPVAVDRLDDSTDPLSQASDLTSRSSASQTPIKNGSVGNDNHSRGSSSSVASPPIPVYIDPTYDPRIDEMAILSLLDGDMSYYGVEI